MSEAGKMEWQGDRVSRMSRDDLAGKRMTIFVAVPSKQILSSGDKYVRVVSEIILLDELLSSFGYLLGMGSLRL